MLRKFALGLAAVTVLAGAVTPAMAHDDWDEHNARYNRHRGDKVYYVDDEKYYYTPRGDIYDRYGRQYEGYRTCDKGTAGLIIGGLAGGSLGYVIARKDRVLGTILGAGVGALAGRAIDKSDDPCRRR